MYDLEFVEGWSAPLLFELMDGVVPLPLLGKEVTIVVTGADNLPVDTDRKLTVLDEATGRVQLLPVEGDFLAANSPYRARFQVSSGYETLFLPNARPMLWKVNPVT